MVLKKNGGGWLPNPSAAGGCEVSNGLALTAALEQKKATPIPQPDERTVWGEQWFRGYN